MSADLALAADPSIVERAAYPGAFIIEACERAKSWLAQALEHGDIDQIVECKSQAEAIRVYTMSKQLGKDAQLSATEIVRRAERGIGVAIRRGQENGEIRRRGQSRVAHQHGGTELMASPTDFASVSELADNGAGIYDLADGVPDGDFEAALAKAKAEESLSRANVVRKIRSQRDGPWIPAADDRTAEAVGRRRELIREMATQGYSSRQISQRIGTGDQTVRQIARDIGVEIPADSVTGRSRHIDSNRIVRETVHALEGAAMGVGLIVPADLDPAEAADWAASLTESLRVLNRLNKTLKEAAQ